VGLIEILAGAQNGAFFANAGRAAGLDPTAAQQALGGMAPVIAAQLRKRAEDHEAFEALLDLIGDGDGDAFLDDASLIADPEVVKDGNAILIDLYGSKAGALKALRPQASTLDESALNKLAPIAASAVLAALARSNKGAQYLTGAPQAADTGGGGLLGTIISAVVKGAMQSAMRQLAPKRRRRRSYTGYVGARKRRRKLTGKRQSRARTPSLDQVFGEILGRLTR
jgi:hypothetical protein